MSRRIVLAALATASLAFASGCSNSNPDGGSSSSSGSSSGGSSTSFSSSSISSSSGSSSSSSSGSSSSSSSSSGSSSGGSSSSSGGVSDGGGDGGPTVTPINPTIPTGANVGAFDEDVDAGLLWITYTYVSDAGSYLGGLVTVDGTTYSTLNNIAGPFVSVVAAPDLGKVFVGTSAALDGGFLAEVDAIDEHSYAVTPIASVQNLYDNPGYLAYDPVQHRVYASVSSNGAGYLYAADAVQNDLITTYDLPDAGSGASGGACAFSSSTSCLESFGQIAVDWSGQKIYLLGGDQNQYPMAATFTLSGADGGSVGNVLGGHAASWAKDAIGIATFDGGAAAAITLADGGGFLQILDPTIDGFTEATAMARFGCPGGPVYLLAATPTGNGTTTIVGFPQSELQAGGPIQATTYATIPTDLCESTVDALICYRLGQNGFWCKYRLVPNRSLCPGQTSVIQQISFPSSSPCN